MSSTKKIVLVGHFGVGKSSLIKRFVENTFSDNYYVTIGVHISKKVITVNQETLTLIIWDIEGKDDLQKIRPAYLLGSSGFMYVIDPTREQTYKHFKAECNYIQNAFPKAALVTVVNKSDLIDTAAFKEQMAMLDAKADFFASAKAGDAVEAIFEELGKRML